MKVAMHNWMRAEPVETTIRRLAKFGYDGIEISYDSVDANGGRERGLTELCAIADRAGLAMRAAYPVGRHTYMSIVEFGAAAFAAPVFGNREESIAANAPIVESGFGHTYS